MKVGPGFRLLVTGGGRRIGRAVALAFAERGARVAIHYRSSRAEAESASAQCPGSILLEADLARPEECESLVRRAWHGLSGLDALVNAAAIYEETPWETVSPGDWDRHLSVNLRAPFLCARAAGLLMRGGSGGAIVQLTDSRVDRPDPRYLPYFAAKAGLEAMTAGLARALAPAVRVNSVAPGPVLLREDASPDERQNVVRAVPLGRIGGVEPVVSAVLFLVENEFITGHSVVIDGGRRLR